MHVFVNDPADVTAFGEPEAEIDLFKGFSWIGTTAPSWTMDQCINLRGALSAKAPSCSRSCGGSMLCIRSRNHAPTDQAECSNAEAHCVMEKAVFSTEMMRLEPPAVSNALDVEHGDSVGFRCWNTFFS